MQKLNTKKRSPVNSAIMLGDRLLKVRPAAISIVALMLFGILPLLVSQAQRLSLPSRVSSIVVQTSGDVTDVAIVADGSLNQAQTWQDVEGYHVVVPGAVAAESLKVSRGVRLRRLGTSLEILLQVKSGAGVNVQSEGNQMQLHINSKLQPRALESERVPPSLEQQLFEPQVAQSQPPTETVPYKISTTTDDLGSKEPLSEPSPVDSPKNKTPAPIVPNEPGQPANTETAAAPPQIVAEPQNEGWMASVFSGTSVLIVFSLGLFGFLVSRKMRSRADVKSVSGDFADEEWEDEEIQDQPTAQTSSNTSLARREPAANGSLRPAAVNRLAVAGPTSLYGAYRIDQEVGKLILGQTHRLDVLSSRAIDDRRAIEASLIKGANAPDLDESARRRAREALEEYGFVARQCASLLLAADPFERTSAARLLGDIKSASALPFLLESLYDSESIVRNQAVVSIGELKIPSAIGALLDIARTHPDVPSSLLSKTLSACSVEGLNFFDAMPITDLLGSGEGSVDEITHLEAPDPVEELPEGSDDPALATALTLLESADVASRSEALKALAQFPVQSVVGAITLVARDDNEPAIRSQAISSLAAINHESVFPAVLLGLTDETREVRAAAARSLSRLSFDRADAYVRVIESEDKELIVNVAKACIKAGIVSQNLDRLPASDHHQAYETFCLICLLAKADITEPIVEAIASHTDVSVRLKAIQMLSSSGGAGVLECLRQLAVRDGMREDVKTALLEALYRLEHSDTKEPEAVEVDASTAEVTTEVIDSEPGAEAEFQVEPEVPKNMDEFEF